LKIYYEIKYVKWLIWNTYKKQQTKLAIENKTYLMTYVVGNVDTLNIIIIWIFVGIFGISRITLYNNIIN